MKKIFSQSFIATSLVVVFIIFNFVPLTTFAAAGYVTLNAFSGQASGVKANTALTISPVYTSFTLATYAGAPGSTVTFIGSGYLPDEPIRITTDRSSGSAVREFNADHSGSFLDNAYQLPSDAAPGPLMFTATGLHSFDTKNILYYVTGK